MEADEPQAHGQYSKILLTGDGGRDGRGSDKLGVKKKDDIEVSLVTSPSVDSNDDNEDGEYNEGNDGDDDGAFGSNNDRDDDDAYDGNRTYFRDICHNVMIRTLTPDVTKLTIGSYPLVEGMFTIKLMKFILLTFASITVVHVLVPYVTDDRDHALELWQIQVFDGNLIVLDCVIFFLVGRLWRQRGVDHLGWIIPMVVCNVYFESQPYFPWLSHSLTLYQMHCVWPWQLWIFVMILIPTIGSIVYLHISRAHQKRLLLMKLVELSLCIIFFMAPLAPSPYFHLHHWYAGWLFGMHCNFDTWWSRLAMSYCWGMYVNGIAVYGRDPVLTCEYAFFLSIDQRCPYMSCYIEALEDMAENPNNATTDVQEMIPVDWRNCSASTDYHP